ncbi:protein translocation ATPase [Alphaproteobacteria bacterium]
MLVHLIKKLFRSDSERFIKKLKPIVRQINGLESEFEKCTDSELREKTEIFKTRLQNGESLEVILPEAFAVVREAAKRVLNMRHFDVQIIGGVVLHRGMIAEMRTGEGKTLVATLPVYLNALTGKGVHVVTVNDYLAQRDAIAWMGPLYNFLGLTVGCLTSTVPEEQRKVVYNCDIVYGTNNEFGFDYLRDNLKHNCREMAQREFYYAIVDEVDSVLVDEARTPLIISGKAEDNSKVYGKINSIILKLSAQDYELDEKVRTVLLTEKGNENTEKILKQHGLISKGSSLYDLENMLIIHHVNQALRAQKLFKCDVDYIVKDQKIMIIDEFTGRILEGRRYSDGLHQAIEAKENAPVQNENQTLASITFQNYFRMYPKLSGMTGTALTEAAEFADIYKLSVLAIPTHVPVRRIDEDDVIYRTAKEKYDAVLDEIERAHKAGQPVLVGTVNIEKSEYISSLLKRRQIKHHVLNAKYHALEAEIIAQAGQPGAVTIATNMAGRGTDIMLGGNAEMLTKQILREKYAKAQSDELYNKIHDEIKDKVEADRECVKKAGGLLVIGTERHESRRIDNQLRGRSGRQGDAGRSKFFLSLEDDLMRLFGSDKISGFLAKMGLKEGEAIVHPWISKALEKAQHKVEIRNYETRKSLLQFDDVINEQRKVVYAKRLHIMKDSQILLKLIGDMVDNVNKVLIQSFIPQKSYKEEWDIDNLKKEVARIYGLHIDLHSYIQEKSISEGNLFSSLNDRANLNIEQKKRECGAEIFVEAVQRIFLLTLDYLWKDHLHSLDNLRAGINLRAYAQKNPLSEYKIEAFELFKQMLIELQERVVQRISHLNLSHETNMHAEKDYQGVAEASDIIQRKTPEDRAYHAVSRNQLCPCNSGKKYKHCHGMI